MGRQTISSNNINKVPTRLIFRSMIDSSWEIKAPYIKPARRSREGKPCQMAIAENGPFRGLGEVAEKRILNQAANASCAAVLVGPPRGGIWWNFVGLSFARSAMSLRDDGTIMAVAELH